MLFCVAFDSCVANTSQDCRESVFGDGESVTHDVSDDEHADDIVQRFPKLLVHQ